MEDVGGGVDTDSVGEVSGTVGSYYMIKKKKCLTIIDDVFDIEYFFSSGPKVLYIIVSNKVGT